jgi:hypothetical protein
MPELTFTLDKPASRNGGDKYVCTSDENFTIYFPQSISRPSSADNKPLQSITITINT